MTGTKLTRLRFPLALLYVECQRNTSQLIVTDETRRVELEREVRHAR